jgi:N-acetylglutamate synthase-like GNAT family acetyltransferase
MSDVTIRKATESDQETIKQMVRAEHLDPTALHWSHFRVADKAGEIIGIGQIRPSPNCRELGSMVVKQPYRGQHIGEMIIEALLEHEPGDVYLECRSHNEGYYQRFGFQRIPWWQAPMPLKVKAGMAHFIAKLFGVELLTMKRAHR